MTEQLGLCFVNSPWAWFTSQPVEEQCGTDWDDAPYQHNAERPSPEEGVTLEKVAFDGPLFAPGEGPRENYDGIESAGHFGNFVSVEEINRGDNPIPWLVHTDHGELYGHAALKIHPGTSIDEFVELVHSAGGQVYRSVDTEPEQRSSGGDC